MSHLAKISRFCFSVFMMLTLSAKDEAQTLSPSLVELQRAYAMRFLEPEPHMALAKYYFDHGNRIEAFYTLEAARRTRFEEKIFNVAFYRAFDGFGNSKAAEARLLAEYGRNPNSIETIDGLADIYISREDWPSAKRYLLTAIQKKPEDFRFTSGLAMVSGSEGKQQEADKLEKDYVKKFPESAIGYAMRAEEITETKPLEARLLLAEAIKRFPEDGRLLFDLAVIYQGEDSQKAEAAFVKAAELAPKSVLIQLWVDAYMDPVVDLMGHEDQGVRWEATQLLKKNVDKSFAERLKALLKDDDLRKRGLAAYIAVYRWKKDSFGLMKSPLSEQSQIVRFDALSALMIEGGVEGRKVALEHSVREPNQTLKKLIEKSQESEQ